MKLLLVTLLGAMSLSLPALADHDKDDFSALTSAASYLNSRVYNSSLSRRVKFSVSQFYNDISNLEYCALEDETDEHLVEANFFDHDRDDCSRLIRDAVRSWHQVDRYLYDTDWDYPGVYRAYLEVNTRVNRTLSTYPR